MGPGGVGEAFPSNWREEQSLSQLALTAPLTQGSQRARSADTLPVLPEAITVQNRCCVGSGASGLPLPNSDGCLDVLLTVNNF